MRLNSDAHLILEAAIRAAADILVTEPDAEASRMQAVP
jgi:hypothetical protein